MPDYGKRHLVVSVACACALLATLLACAIIMLDPVPASADAGSSDLQAGRAVESHEATGAEAAIAAKASKKPAKPSKKQLAAFKKSSASFSMKLFKRCVAAKGKNANVTVAPMSVLTALAMTANGAAGKTEKQLRRVLAGGASTLTLDKNLRWFNANLHNSSKARLKNANSIWYDTSGSLKMKKKFLATNKKYLKSQVEPLDFTDPDSVGTVNAWVAEHTNDMIKKIVDRLEPDDRIALVNAQYFDAKWLSPFMADDVTKSRFTTASGKKRKVDMMRGTEWSYIEDGGVKGFVKPYAKGYSYVALLPAKGTSLKKYVSTLNGDSLASLVKGATRTKVSIGIPKYSVTYSNDAIERQLAKLGITVAFDRSKANFKKMGTDPTGNLYIGSVVHKTRVDVDEEGTRAAAVTGVMMKANSVSLEKPKVVILNRPFVYAIVDNSTKLPLFIGTVCDVGK